MVRYEALQKTLGITKAQLDAAESGKTGADAHQDAMARSEAWMDQELLILVCPSCQVEHTWLWWAFARVHDPSPFFLCVRCPCGQVMEAGERGFGQKVTSVSPRGGESAPKRGVIPHLYDEMVTTDSKNPKIGAVTK